MQTQWAPIILKTVEKLKTCYHPLKIILFGSYARHEEVEDSDIDILKCVARHQKLIQED
jgi:predicted nucleotidyltransferase